MEQPEDDCEVEVYEEADSRKTMEMRKKKVTKDIRKLMNETVEHLRKENWQKKLAQIEQRPNELLLGHAKTHKMPQKLPSLEERQIGVDPQKHEQVVQTE